MLILLVVAIIVAVLISGVFSFAILRKRSAGVKTIVFVLMFVLCIWVEYKTLVEWKATSRRKQLCAICAVNLKQVCQAIHMYKNSNADTYPDSLVSLYPEYLPDGQVFYCPRLIINWSINNTDMAGITWVRVPEYVPEWSNGVPEKVNSLSEIDYVYHKPAVNSSPSDILVEEKALNHPMGLRNTKPVRLFIRIDGNIGESKMRRALRSLK